MKPLILLTARQKKIAQTHDKIARRYSMLKAAANETEKALGVKTSDHQLFIKVAQEYETTQANVRKICLAKGVAQPARGGGQQ